MYSFYWFLDLANIVMLYSHTMIFFDTIQYCILRIHAQFVYGFDEIIIKFIRSPGTCKKWLILKETTFTVCSSDEM